MKQLNQIVVSIIAVLFTAGCASPEVRELRKSYAEASRGNGPVPKIGTDAFGARHWSTHDGMDAGAETYETRVIHQGLRDFNLNLAFQGFKTSRGYWVGQDENRYFIFFPTGDPRIEIYGPNLKSIRALRRGEKSLIEQGGDILYITGEGIFKASELGD
jgi:hypothetical protein